MAGDDTTIGHDGNRRALHRPTLMRNSNFEMIVVHTLQIDDKFLSLPYPEASELLGKENASCRLGYVRSMSFNV